MKRMLREYYSVAEHEVALLRRSDHHPNVVRYYCMEVDRQFLYIGLELGVASLVEVVEHVAKPRPAAVRDSAKGAPTMADCRLGVELCPEVRSRLRDLDKAVLARDIMSGLAHLHSLNIVHRDIKPHNVLVSQGYRAVLSDFGLCAALPDNQSSFQTTNAGTTGWTAPEMLRDHRMTRAVDVFSAGCVLHYLLRGGHPFGVYFEREMNIRKARRRITRGDPIEDDLILAMLEDDAKLRISANAVLAHP